MLSGADTMAIGKNIKGITIEFDGDTKKLDRALRDVKAEAKGVDKALRDVNKQLKTNPRSTELQAQKQQLLKQKISQTKKELNALKAAQAKLDEDPSVDKTSAEYMELRREIIRTEQKLKSLEKEQKKLDQAKFENLGNRIQEIGKKFDAAGKALSKYVTGPILAIGAASIYAFNELDKGLDTVATKTGATGEELENMKQIVKDLSTEIPTDFETAGAAVGEVNTRFGATGDQLEELSGQFIKFAKINNTDVSSSIDGVQKAMAAYGMTTEETGTMLDTLTLVGQKTGIGMDQLISAMTTAAPQMQAMGFDAQRAAFFIGGLETSGIDSSKALAGLNKAIVNGAKEGKALPEVMNEIQDSIVNASSETEAMNAAVEIFGAKAGPAIATAARNGSLDFAALANSAEDSAGTLERTFQNTLDPIDTFKMTLNSLKVTGAEVGTTLLQMLQPIIETLGEKLKQLNEWWNNLSPGMQNFIIKIAGVAAAVGPALIVIGKLLTTVGMIIKFIPAIVKGIQLISAVMAANPWILLIMAIVAAIILIATHWEQVKAIILKVWEALKTAAEAIWEAIKQSIIVPIQTVIAFLKKAWQAIKIAAKVAWQVIKGVILGPMQLAVAGIKAVWNGAKAFLSTVWNGIKAVASNVWSGIKKVIVDPIQNAWNTLKGIVDKIKGLFPLKIGKLFEGLQLPKIKITKGKAPWGVGGKGTAPTFGLEWVNWYAKGGIFNSPSVIGVGEAGAEAVVPLDKLWSKMEQLNRPAGDININVYASPGMSVNELADAVSRKMIQEVNRRRIAW